MDPSRIWDERYARQDPAQAHSSYEPWLERWYPRLQAQIDRPLLDLGCGNGLDAAYLIQRGFRVVGAELSRAALLLARDNAPTAHLVRLDLHAPLPYRTDTFGVVVANLSLHYFPWDHTRHIVDRVRALLHERGWLLARFNSVEEADCRSPEARWLSRDYYTVDGIPKRFFSRSSLEQLFGRGWRLHELEQQTVHCYGHAKRLWEVAADCEIGDGPGVNLLEHPSHDVVA